MKPIVVSCYNDNSSRSSSGCCSRFWQTAGGLHLGFWQIENSNEGAVQPPAVRSIWSQNCQPTFNFGKLATHFQLWQIGNRCLMQISIVPVLLMSVHCNHKYHTSIGANETAASKIIRVSILGKSSRCLMQASITCLQFNLLSLPCNHKYHKARQLGPE